MISIGIILILPLLQHGLGDSPPVFTLDTNEVSTSTTDFPKIDSTCKGGKNEILPRIHNNGLCCNCYNGSMKCVNETLLQCPDTPYNTANCLELEICGCKWWICEEDPISLIDYMIRAVIEIDEDLNMNSQENSDEHPSTDNSFEEQNLGSVGDFGEYYGHRRRRSFSNSADEQKLNLRKRDTRESDQKERSSTLDHPEEGRETGNGTESKRPHKQVRRKGPGKNSRGKGGNGNSRQNGERRGGNGANGMRRQNGGGGEGGRGNRNNANNSSDSKNHNGGSEGLGPAARNIQNMRRQNENGDNNRNRNRTNGTGGRRKKGPGHKRKDKKGGKKSRKGKKKHNKNRPKGGNNIGKQNPLELPDTKGNNHSNYQHDISYNDTGNVSAYWLSVYSGEKPIYDDYNYYYNTYDYLDDDPVDSWDSANRFYGPGGYPNCNCGGDDDSHEDLGPNFGHGGGPDHSNDFGHGGGPDHSNDFGHYYITSDGEGNGSFNPTGSTPSHSPSTDSTTAFSTTEVATTVPVTPNIK